MDEHRECMDEHESTDEKRGDARMQSMMQMSGVQVMRCVDADSRLDLDLDLVQSDSPH